MRNRKRGKGNTIHLFGLELREGIESESCGTDDLKSKLREWEWCFKKIRGREVLYALNTIQSAEPHLEICPGLDLKNMARTQQPRLMLYQLWRSGGMKASGVE